MLILAARGGCPGLSAVRCALARVLWVLATTTCEGTPNVSVSGLTFDDLDLDAGELAGIVEWEPPTSTESVASYVIGLASDGSGSDFRVVGSVELGANSLAVAADTVADGATHLVVYTSDSHGQRALPASVELDDVTFSVSEVTLLDMDLDRWQLGGTVTWSCAIAPAALAQYVVYLSTSPQGAGRWQVGEAVVVGTNSVSLPMNTPTNLFSFVAVYAASSAAEQTTPAVAIVNDTASSVSNLGFEDQDLDLAQLGGAILWDEPPDLEYVLNYSAYWAEDAGGSVRELIQTVAVGTTVIHVPPETALLSQTHVLVYAWSVLGEQTTPVAHQFLDHVSSVANLAFADLDLDAEEIGGNVTWITPADPFQVSHYRVYLALSFGGVGRSQLGSDVPAGAGRPYVPANTPREDFTHMLVYTVSALVEQSTPAGIVLQDTFSGVSRLSFTDLDLDDEEVGGTVSWAAPADVSHVESYAVYVAPGEGGSSRAQLGDAVAVHTNAVTIPAEFGLASFTHLLVHAVSVLDEQSTPSWVAIEDTRASVADLAFTDLDLDAEELGGSVTWSPPANVVLVQSYHVFLAATAAGASRVGLGSSVPSGTDALHVSADTPWGGLPFIVVFAASALAEQSTPAALGVVDSAQSVASVVFTDQDLDAAEIGGTVTWDPPVPALLVAQYALYLAATADGVAKASVSVDDSSAVAGGTNEMLLPSDTSVSSHTHVVVFTRSSLAEQTTPAAALLSDQAAFVTDLSFQDLDGDASELGGTLTWAPPLDALLVTHHVVYLASSSSAGANRSQLGSVLVGTNSLNLLVNTPRGTLSHLAIHERSAFTEQSTPAGAIAVVDLDATVLELTFGDSDFDLGEIGGCITWAPPVVGLASVTHFSVYLAEDQAGTGLWRVGGEVSVGTNLVRLPVNTAVGSWTHVLVFSRTSLAYQTTPTTAAIADAPSVTTSTRWTIANAVPTEPGGNRRWAMADDAGDAGGLGAAGVPWRVQDVVFFSDAACSDVLQGVRVSSGQWGQYHGTDEAFDGNPDTAWHSQCAPCAAFEAWLGIVVEDVVRCVRWLQAPVATGEGAGSIAFQIGGQEFTRASGLHGGGWEGLQYSAAGGGWQRT